MTLKIETSFFRKLNSNRKRLWFEENKLYVSIYIHMECIKPQCYFKIIFKSKKKEKKNSMGKCWTFNVKCVLFT